MPAGDRTGPEGMGPMTGRGAGYCAAGQMNNAGPGIGFGRGRGAGRGYGFRCFGNRGAAVPYIPPTREQQLDELKAQSKYLESELKTIRERIGNIESE